MIYGIDLGTTFTSAAYCTPDGKVNVCEFDAGRGDGTTVNVLPSTVLFAGANYAIVGRRARDEFTDSDAQRLVEMVKPSVGKIDPHTKRSRTWRYNGVEFRPQDIQALILRGLRRLIELNNYPPLERAVISHPQYFKDPQKKATVESARLAGIEVVDTITEPAAAALAYGLDRRVSVGENPHTVFVFDLGGGTFDIVILEVKGPPLRIVGVTSDGSAQLGGGDWDKILYEKFVDEIKACGYDFETEANFVEERKLMELANRTKEVLSRSASTRVTLMFAGQRKVLTVGEDDLRIWSAILLDKVRMFCQRALGRTHKTEADIDDVLLVGGSSKMPMIQDLVRQLFDREPLYDEKHVRTIVAEGAALKAHQCELKGPNHPNRDELIEMETETGLTVSGSGILNPPLAYGIGVKVKTDNGEEIIKNLMPKDTTCPATFTGTFPVENPKASRVRISFYEGESECEGECTHVGDVVFEVPPRTDSREIKLSLNVDESTKLRIDAIDIRTGVAVTKVIEHQALLSADEFEVRKKLLDSFDVDV